MCIFIGPDKSDKNEKFCRLKAHEFRLKFFDRCWPIFVIEFGEKSIEAQRGRWKPTNTLSLKMHRERCRAMRRRSTNHIATTSCPSRFAATGAQLHQCSTLHAHVFVSDYSILSRMKRAESCINRDSYANLETSFFPSASSPTALCTSLPRAGKAIEAARLCTALTIQEYRRRVDVLPKRSRIMREVKL